MKRKLLLIALVALPLAATGVAYGRTQLKTEQPPKAGGYTCPLTGEELPCPNCCPLKK